MAAPTFNTLPADIFDSILSYLDARTVRIVALADKQTRALARRALFHDVTIKVKGLETEVRELQHILERNSCLGLVRHLRIDGELGQKDHVHVRADQDENRDFAALEGFLPDLELTKLTWACSQQFPRSCLTILHHKLPACRLFLESFRLYSIYDPSLEMYERELMSSPNLDGILCGAIERPDFKSYKVLWHILGLAPNLRLLDAQHGTSPFVIPKRFVDPPTESAWFGPTTRMGHLRELYCPHAGDVLKLKRVELWQQATDFSDLRILSLWRGCEKHSAAEVYQHLQTNCNFQNLIDLALRFPDTPSHEDRTALQDLLRSLRPLSALAVKGDIDSTLMSPILEAHGGNLRKLELTPYIGYEDRSGRVVINRLERDVEEVLQMFSHCRLLEELTFTSSRCRGSQDEVAVYRAIGATLPRLQYLTLNLDASSLTVFGGEAGGEPEDYQSQEEVPSDVTYDDFDNESYDPDDPFEGVVHLRNGHVRDALINSAIDADLARSIFDVIAAAKTGEVTFPLEALDITVSGGGWFGTESTLSSIATACKYLGKSWHVQRGIRDDSRNEVVVTEVPSGSSDASEEFDELDWESLEPILTRLWPSITKDDFTGDQANGGRKRGWSSWPLQI